MWKKGWGEEEVLVKRVGRYLSLGIWDEWGKWEWKEKALKFSAPILNFIMSGKMELSEETRHSWEESRGDNWGKDAISLPISVTPISFTLSFLSFLSILLLQGESWKTDDADQFIYPS